MIRVKAYKCGFCNMVSFYSSSVQRHERAYCKKNRGRKTCLNCTNLEREPYESETGAGGEFCNKYSIKIHVEQINENRSCDGFNEK
jgi:hypothetical protein